MKKDVGEPPNKGEVGRDSLYRDHYPEEARKLCLLGATDQFLAEFFEISLGTLHNWKKDYPEFLDSIRAGKAVADMEVAKSLYDNALGFEYEEEIAIKVKTSQHSEKVEVVTVQKKIPPDYRSISLWLRNRQPEVWRDKIEIETEGTLTVFEPDMGEKKLNEDKETNDDG